MNRTPYGWFDALLDVHRPRVVGDHSPFFGCPCLTCERTRRNIERYGFTDEGKIAGPSSERVAFPWEQDAA